MMVNCPIVSGLFLSFTNHFDGLMDSVVLFLYHAPTFGSIPFSGTSLSVVFWLFQQVSIFFLYQLILAGQNLHSVGWNWGNSVKLLHVMSSQLNSRLAGKKKPMVMPGVTEVEYFGLFLQSIGSLPRLIQQSQVPQCKGNGIGYQKFQKIGKLSKKSLAENIQNF